MGSKMRHLRRVAQREVERELVRETPALAKLLAVSKEHVFEPRRLGPYGLHSAPPMPPRVRHRWLRVDVEPKLRVLLLQMNATRAERIDDLVRERMGLGPS